MTGDLREQNIKAQGKNKNFKMIPILCNNNTRDVTFLVQMKQSNKCGSVRNDEILNLQ